MRALRILAAAIAAGSLHGETAPDLAPVKKWLAQQREVRTIQADFVQTRALRTLRSPITAKGRFWFQSPSSLRWQIGEPPATVVLSTGNTAWLIQPKKMAAEKSTAGDNARTLGFGMMNLPMAADIEEFQRAFEILSVKADASRCRLEVLPRDAQARRFLAKIVLDFDTRSGQLLGFEAVTREGSSLRSEFQNVVLNQKITPDVFDYDFTGYKLKDVHP